MDTNFIKNKKRKYKRIVDRGVVEKYKPMLIEEIKKEWENVERGAKNEQIIAAAKEAGMQMGRLLLGLALIGGVLTLGVVAPNMLGAIGKLNARRRFFDRKQFLKTKDYLKRRGYIEFLPTAENGVYTFRLTRKGEQYIFDEQLQRRKILCDPKQWDGRWRLVLFDVPERHKSVREALRKQLCAMGLYPLQESVFVSPFPVKEEITFIAEMFGITAGVRCVEAVDVGSDMELKSFWCLN